MESELTDYVDYLTDYTVSKVNSKRKTTITKFNYFKPAILHTGKYTFERSFTRHHISLKLGDFTKTRKPFYFRSKKKKNVTKKYNLPNTVTPFTIKF